MYLVCSHTSTVIPLASARQYRFRTDLFGDTEGTITLDAAHAALLRMADIGTEVVVWHDAIGMVWRGQIEALTGEPDGTTTIGCLGVGRLIGDIPVSAVGSDQRPDRWEIAERNWITNTPFLPNPSRWSISKTGLAPGILDAVTMTAQVNTTYASNEQAWVIYRYPAPQLLVAAGSVGVTFARTGQITSAVVGTIKNPTAPYEPLTAITISDTNPIATVTIPSGASGVYVRTNTVGTITAPSSVTITITPTDAILVGTFAPALATHLSTMTGQTISVRVLVAPLAHRIDDFAGSFREYLTVLRTSGKPIWASIHRDTLTVMITQQPRGQRYAVRPAPVITRDWSTLPTHVYGRWHDGVVPLLTDAASASVMMSRKRYYRHQIVDAPNALSAQQERDRVRNNADAPNPVVRAVVTDVYPALISSGGVIVPACAAEPGGILHVASMWQDGVIVAREIGSDGVTYDVEIPITSLADVARRLS